MPPRLPCLIILFVTLTMACKKDHELDCFKSTGKEVTIYRESRAFTQIDLKDNVDLVLRPDTAFYIKVTAGEHLIDGIITELSGKTLYIRNENKCNWVRSFKNKYTVEVGVDHLESLACYGSGTILCTDTIRTDYFAFDSWNASGNISLLVDVNTIHIANNTGRINLHVNGHAVVSQVYINDTGVMDASQLQTDYTYMANKSTGDCRIWVEKELGVSITYIGNIYYRGNPYKIDQSISGTGQLIHE